MYYNTLVDAYHLKEESMKALNDVAGDILDLKVSVHDNMTLLRVETRSNCSLAV